MKAPSAPQPTPDDPGADSTQVVVEHRKVWVFRRRVRGVRAEVFSVKGKLQNGKQFFRCTNESKKANAVKVGKALFAAALHERRDVLMGWSRVKGKRLATIGEILAAHEKGIEKASVKLRGRSGYGYRRSMQRLIAWGMKLHATAGPGEGERRQVDEAAIGRVPASVLTAELVANFETAYLAPHRGNPVRLEQALRTAHSVVRNARSLFGRRAMKCYAGLELPDLNGFLTEPLNEAEAVRHKRLDDEAVKEMAAASVKLKTSEPELYLVHLLARQLALRPVEIEALRVGWLKELRTPKTVSLPSGEKREIVAVCAVEKTEFYDPKGSSGEVPISACVWDELRPYLEGRDNGELAVRAESDRARHELIYRRHADFCRPWTSEHQKKAYELRRWAATKIAMLHGVVEMAERFIRHSPRRKSVAELHYITELALPAPLTLADVGLAPSLVVRYAGGEE